MLNRHIGTIILRVGVIMLLVFHLGGAAWGWDGGLWDGGSEDPSSTPSTPPTPPTPPRCENLKTLRTLITYTCTVTGGAAGALTPIPLGTMIGAASGRAVCQIVLPEAPRCKPKPKPKPTNSLPNSLQSELWLKAGQPSDPNYYIDGQNVWLHSGRNGHLYSASFPSLAAPDLDVAREIVNVGMLWPFDDAAKKGNAGILFYEAERKSIAAEVVGEHGLWDSGVAPVWLP